MEVGNNFVPMAQVIAEDISRMIFVDKIYGPNERLPNEHDFAEELGVSRTSLREAIKILMAKGVLVVKRGSGTFVSPAPHGESELFGIAYIEDKMKLAENWYEYRLINEPPCARLVAEKATDDEVSRIVSSAHKIKDLVENNESIMEEDQNFHSLIAMATHNDILHQSLPSIKIAVNDSLNLSSMLGYLSLSGKNAALYHPVIADFIKGRDPYGAELAMRYHILKGLEDFQSTVDELSYIKKRPNP